MISVPIVGYFATYFSITNSFHDISHDCTTTAQENYDFLAEELYFERHYCAIVLLQLSVDHH